MIKRFLRTNKSLTNYLDREEKLRHNILRHEAKVGGTLFGPVPVGTRREFFCLDEYTWIWYEEWTGKNGKRQSRTTRYNVLSDGVLKSINGQSYLKVSREEAKRLLEAAEAYQQKVEKEVYQPILKSI